MNAQPILSEHNRAMMLAQEAIVRRTRGDDEGFRRLNREAFSIESGVALALSSAIDNEPMRSILFRSAASMALNSGLYREAEQMACMGLAGNPPDDVAQELRALLEDVRFHRRLSERGVQMSLHSLHMYLTGEEVGYGFIEAPEFLRRYQAVSNLVFRTAQRHFQQPFQGRSIPGDIMNNYMPYFGAPGRGSFQVEIRFGRVDPGQVTLFEDIQQTVLTEVVECLEMANQGNVERLREHIGDGDYYLNFVQLSKVVAPDGDKVQSVTISTTPPGGGVRSVYMRKPREEYPTFRKAASSERIRKNKEIEAVGVLKVADSEASRIRIVDDKDEKTSRYDVQVSSGLVDLVRVYFDTRVRAIIRSLGKNQFELVEVEAADY